VWAAGVAGDRLGVKATTQRVGIFRGTGGIHRPRGHRGRGPIVGQAEEDRVSRAAVCAVDVGISIPLVGRVEAFSQAVFAYRQIGRDMDSGTLRVMALADVEFLQIFTGCGFDFNFGDHGGRWRVTSHLLNERLHVSFGAFQMDLMLSLEPATIADRRYPLLFQTGETAFGKPIVAAAAGGSTDLVEDRVNGILVPPRDPVALVRALELLLRDDLLRSTLGRRGAEIVRRKYRFDLFRGRICTILADCGLASIPPS